MKISFLNLLVLLSIISGCSNPPNSVSFSNEDFKPETNLLTPETVWKFGRISDVTVSPNQQQILFSVAYTNIAENKSYTDLYITTTDGSKRQITHSADNEFAALWHPDGKKIGFLSSQTGETQLWEINTDDLESKQVTHIKGGITNFKYSPTGKKILFTARVKLDSTVNEMYPDLPLANARIENDMMYRHWDAWSDYSYSHIFVADYNDGEILGEPIDLMKGERFDSPMQPFEDMSEIEWSTNGLYIAYTCKKMAGKDYSLSTNSDIYLVNTQNQQTTNVTRGNMGYDRNPVFSPDGHYMAYESMERDGFESDKKQIKIINLNTHEIKNYSTHFDQNGYNFTWGDDGKTLYFISENGATEQMNQLNINDGQISQLTTDQFNYQLKGWANKMLIGTKTSMSQPAEIYTIDPTNGASQNISNINTNVLAQLKFGNVESRQITTTDNKKMQTWVIYPPDFDPSKKYPTLLYCQGGPQQTVSQFWSLRWNFQLMAANGYIVVAPNRRGLPGFGQAWNDQISGDYGGQNMLDYLSAIDSMAKEPYVDQTKLGAIGASYGGFSVYWLAGNHNKRFKAFIAHCGLFNLEQMYATTDEHFFVNWDLKGAFWDEKNTLAQKSYAASPHNFVQNWDTPMLVIHGEKDFRVPYTQGLGAFNSAILKGVPARFLYFPDENHFVQKPQNAIVWHREFYKWLDKWLK